VGASGFDLATLEKIQRQLGERRFCDIIGIFLDNTPGRLRRVQQGVSSDDLDDSAEALHSIKSSAAMFGADELEQVAESMERAAREQRVDDFRSGLPDLERTIRAVGEFLRQRIEMADS